ncbi:KpsF/GutQ family sugar-phosphate isomerase [Sulfitobacter sp. NFXS29]|uniref:KpsF/GutQ family sugar-phosphate isomerase n=1 Tax=Sulfitobacter sp. NFXS29 TaxID=2818438 RepID=UPI0032DE6904
MLDDNIIKDNNIVKVGKDVILQESEALVTLADELPESFAAVVNLILGSQGRVIVSGVGKSGHIGRKISATLASTGTPSFFVHATEASHGDLGMATPNDICVLISNSGETKELSDLVAHTRRFSIPLIAISSGGKSALIKAADYGLLLPSCPEACPMGMAPTTSTTLALALGDALAIALMKERDFQPEHFRTFHPGGKLGAQLALVSQLMHEGEAIPMVRADTMMDEALLEMTSKGFGTTGVLRHGRLFGVISDGDLRRNMARLMSCSAEEVATIDPITVSPCTFATQALARMNEMKITALFVVDDMRKPVGILHMHDLLRTGVV